MNEKTPKQLIDERTHDVMAYAYRDTDGKLYTVNDSGQRVEAAADAKPLAPEFQKIAEQTAALAMMYNKVLALEPEQRGILARLFKDPSGSTTGLREEGKKLLEEVNTLRKDAGVKMPGEDSLDFLSKAANGFALLPTFLSDVAGAGADALQQIGGGQISRENAIAIGTAVASARQVAASGRPMDPGLGDYFSGLFSQNFGSYASGGFWWLLDQIVGLVEHIPVLGEWIKKQGWSSDKSLKQRLDEASRDDDNAHVEKEIAEVGPIGGVSPEDLQVLTRGGIVRTVDGSEATVAAPDADNAAPTLPEEPAAPATPDEAAAAAAAAKAAAEAAGNDLSTVGRVWGALKNADFSASKETREAAGTAGVLIGGTLLTSVGVGVGAGMAKRLVIKPVGQVAEDFNNATGTVKGLDARIAKAAAGKGRFIDALPAEDLAKLEARRVEEIAKANVAQAKMDKLGVSIEAAKDASGKALAGGELTANLKAQRLDALKGTTGGKAVAWFAENAEKERTYVALKPWRWTGAIGRLTGSLTARAMELTGDIVGAGSRFASREVSQVVAVGSDLAEGVAAKAVAAQELAAKTIARVTPASSATAKAADVALDAAEHSGGGLRTGAARLLGGVPRVGRWLKVGLVGLGTTSAVAHAKEAKAKYSAGNQLDGDAETVDTLSYPAGFIPGLGIPISLGMSQVADGMRLEAASNRAKLVPDVDAQALIAMIPAGGKFENPDLQKIATLKAELVAREKAGKSLEVAVTLYDSGKRIMHITDKMSSFDISMANGMAGETGVFTSNAKIPAMLTESAKLYLGSDGTVQSIAAMLGVKVPAQPASGFTPEQLAAAHAGVKEQAHKAATRAAVAMVNGSVKVGAVTKPPTADDSISFASIGGKIASLGQLFA